MFEKFAVNQLSEVLVECEIRSQHESDLAKRYVFIEVSQKLNELIKKFSVETLKTPGL